MTTSPWMQSKVTPPAPVAAVSTGGSRFHFVRGGSFVLDVPDTTPAVWGDGQQVIWAEGEALMIAAGSGLGKTTLAGQLVAARLGLLPGVLGLPVAPGQRVLYLAMDRPAQTKRALGRLFTDEQRAALDERLFIWEGPPPEDMAVDTDLLADMCAEAEADMCVIDSLKDAALGLSDDKVGAGWNRARQAALVAGVQVLELHHMRKQNADGKAPDSLADVYGSGWLTAGSGSVVGLLGSAGDSIVGWRHLKQPAEEVGPWQVEHDHDTGRSKVFHAADLLAMAKLAPLTARFVAAQVNGTDKPTAAEIQKYRRKLDKLVKSGHLQLTKGTGQSPDSYELGGLPSAWSAA